MSIGKNAFQYCSNLTSINYLGNIESWCKIEFEGAYSNPLYYADKFLVNGEEAKDVVIPETVTEIKNYTFRSCSSLTSIIISDSVTNIGNSAFSNCKNLTSVSIPNNVTSIGEYAFSNCSSLSIIYFDGTINEWKAITKGSCWKLSSDITIYCTDGKTW